MENQIRIWNLLHDGVIIETKKVETDIYLKIEIEYLLERISSKPKFITVILSNPTFFLISDWDGKNMGSELPNGFIAGFEIFGASYNNEVIEIIGDGKIQMACPHISYKLECGKSFSIDDLEKLAREYWSEWELKNNQN